MLGNLGGARAAPGPVSQWDLAPPSKPKANASQQSRESRFPPSLPAVPVVPHHHPLGHGGRSHHDEFLGWKAEQKLLSCGRDSCRCLGQSGGELAGPGGRIPVLQVRCVPATGAWGQQEVAGEGAEPQAPLRRQRNRRFADKIDGGGIRHPERESRVKAFWKRQAGRRSVAQRAASSGAWDCQAVAEVKTAAERFLLLCEPPFLRE